MEYFLETKNISVRFGGIQALDNVSVHVNQGEILCLAGENGAGKSTLAKTFIGINTPTNGTICIQGEQFKSITPMIARQKGMSIVSQEQNLMMHLSIAENIYMFDPDCYRHGIYQYKKGEEKTKRLFHRLNQSSFPHPKTKVSELTVGQQQIVEIMKAVALENQLIVFDEPTTSLSFAEIESLFAVMRQLKESGVAVILVTHKFDEIFKIADYVTVLCDGKLIQERIPVAELDQYKLARLMVGREFKSFFGEKIPRTIGDVVLKVEGLSDGRHFSDVSFELREHEILGFAGLVGAGRTEVMETIFGARHVKSGEIYLRGQKIARQSTKRIIRKGMALVTEDRKHKGLCLNLPIGFNMALAGLNLTSKTVVTEKKFSNDIENSIDRLNIKLDTLGEPASSLSGGNQQKVVLSKWLMLDSDVIIFDEPTKGIDVGSKVEIYNLIRHLAVNGKNIIIVSSELQELMALSDRILVMNNGRLVAEVDPEEVTEQQILAYAV